ncbi:hypothetical protein BDQ17DRAFT_1412206 [Cyathus striatus]|nr:hypothetical protein BDQ17DRAFT_1412206 [Cyathus striatus]
MATFLKKIVLNFVLDDDSEHLVPHAIPSYQDEPLSADIIQAATRNAVPGYESWSSGRVAGVKKEKGLPDTFLIIRPNTRSLRAADRYDALYELAMSEKELSDRVNTQAQEASIKETIQQTRDEEDRRELFDQYSNDLKDARMVASFEICDKIIRYLNGRVFSHLVPESDQRAAQNAGFNYISDLFNDRAAHQELREKLLSPLTEDEVKMAQAISALLASGLSSDRNFRQHPKVSQQTALRLCRTWLCLRPSMTEDDIRRLEKYIPKYNFIFPLDGSKDKTGISTLEEKITNLSRNL